MTRRLFHLVGFSLKTHLLGNDVDLFAVASPSEDLVEWYWFEVLEARVQVGPLGEHGLDELVFVLVTEHLLDGVRVRLAGDDGLRTGKWLRWYVARGV
jgi:hypothetical protein